MLHLLQDYYSLELQQCNQPWYSTGYNKKGNNRSSNIFTENICDPIGTIEIEFVIVIVIWFPLKL